MVLRVYFVCKITFVWVFLILIGFCLILERKTIDLLGSTSEHLRYMRVIALPSRALKCLKLYHLSWLPFVFVVNTKSHSSDLKALQERDKNVWSMLLMDRVIYGSCKAYDRKQKATIMLEPYD